MKSAATQHRPAEAEAGATEKTYKFLEGRRSGVLATVDAVGGRPHAAVVYYSVAPDRSIRFLTKADTRKARNIEAGGSVMFTVYDEHDQTVVQVSGTARRIEDPVETHQQFERTLRSSLRTADSAVPPIAKLAAGEYAEYAITPDEIRYSDYKQRRSDCFKVA